MFPGMHMISFFFFLHQILLPSSSALILTGSHSSLLMEPSGPVVSTPKEESRPQSDSPSAFLLHRVWLGQVQEDQGLILHHMGQSSHCTPRGWSGSQRHPPSPDQ